MRQLALPIPSHPGQAILDPGETIRHRVQQDQINFVSTPGLLDLKQLRTT